MAADKHHLQDEQLSDGVNKAAAACGKFLRNTQYQAQGDFEICNDSSGLKEDSREFYTQFAPLIRGDCEVRVTALRFSKSAKLPVKKGATVDLIPVFISGNPSVSKKAVRLGWSLHLTMDVIVEPDFCCLAILTQ